MGYKLLTVKGKLNAVETNEPDAFATKDEALAEIVRFYVRWLFCGAAPFLIDDATDARMEYESITGKRAGDLFFWRPNKSKPAWFDTVVGC